MFVFFIKMKMDDDVLYIGEIKDEGGDTKLENGFYLISAAQEWKVENLKAEQKFAGNPDNDKEFVLKGVKLAEGDKIKVVKVENEAIVAWYPDGEGTEYTVDAKHAGDNKDIYFQEEYKEDWKAFGGFFWTGENGEGGGAKLENGFYLISEALEWKVENLTADLKFDANPGAENEFMKKTRLSEGAKIKVVKVEADAAVKWYPEGNETEYVVDAAHAGDVTIYFQEEKKSDWEEFGGFFFIVAEGGEGIDNTVVEAVAVKMIENGMLIIEKAGVRYNVMGQVIR
jgi:predicted DNA-binding antitoxin AbrB/MazE fold protein